MRSETRSELTKVLNLCLKEAGQILKKGFGTKIQVRLKGPVNPVTEIDLAAEKKIVSLIRKNYPNHRILTEESQPYPGDSRFRWIIDPLDGTTNYAHAIPLCCVSIGIEEAGKVILGGIFNPMIGELFFAEKGKGAYLNGKRIQVSKTEKLIDSLLVTGFPYDRQKKADYYLKFFGGLMRETLGIRRLGAAAMDLSYVACGRFDAFWELNLQPWDVAAGVLLVQEAGGKVTNFEGEAFAVDRPLQLLSSNGRIHPQVLSIFKSIQ